MASRDTSSRSWTVAPRDPCSFGPAVQQARSLAAFYARRFEPGDRVLDIGFGRGYFLEAARERGVQAIGVDRDPDLVTAARQQGHIAHCSDVGDLARIVGGRFDGAIASHLIEHLHPVEVRDLCADVAAIVNPDSSFIIATPNFRDIRVATEWFWLDPSHVRPYPGAALEQLIQQDQWRLEASGFEPVRPTRNVLSLAINRLRFGHHYGRPGNWYVLRRK